MGREVGISTIGRGSARTDALWGWIHCGRWGFAGVFVFEIFFIDVSRFALLSAR